MVVSISRAELYSDGPPIAVELPVDVHSALHRAGLIADPLGAGGAKACADVESKTWWYRFSLPDLPGLAAGQRRRLVFEGLDTNATVEVDGREVATHRNMFRPLELDLAPGSSEVTVRFDPVTEGGSGGSILSGAPERLYARKAQFGWGWDWAPRLPSIGIWRPVELRTETRAVIESVHASTVEIDSRRAVALLKVAVDIDAFAAEAPLEAHIKLTAPDGTEAAAAVVPAGDAAHLEVRDPQLWWPHDLGEPALYDLEIELRHGDENVDSARRRVGIRTVELDQTPDPQEPGTRFFRFLVNGVPIFARGANWVPAHSFPGAVTQATYRHLIGLAKTGEMNMLRIWGGGIYESDTFYDLCDEAGILVWQDFMFACADYPDGDTAFMEEVRLEARHQVRRLRSHACLALWCGNNESQWLCDAFGRTTGSPPSSVDASIYNDLLPATVAELDGRNPYWPGSPYGGNDHNSMEEGDRHDWKVWHGAGPTRFGEMPNFGRGPDAIAPAHYLEDRGRFISEFGVIGAANISTLQAVLPEAEARLGSEALMERYRDRLHDKLEWLMEAETGAPRDFREYVEFSQAVQAVGVKLGVDHFRRRWPHCAGALVWQLNDCWPAISWSLIDHAGLPKAVYHALRRAFAPVVATFAPTDEGVQVQVVNNSRDEVALELVIESLGYSGDARLVRSETITAPALSSRTVLTVDRELADDASRYLRLRSAGGRPATERYFPVPLKDRPLPGRPPQVEVLGQAVKVAAAEYTPLVRLKATGATFEDDAFDLDGGEERLIPIAGSAPAIVEVTWLYRARVTDTVR